jgi:CBS domain-containing protein
MPRIIELARTTLIKADISATFQDISSLMIENNVGSIVIVENEEIIGYIDVISILKILSRNKNPLEEKIIDVLTKFPKIDKNMEILDVWDKIKDNNVERYGVSDNEKIIGIFKKQTVNDFRVTLLKNELNIED